MGFFSWGKKETPPTKRETPPVKPPAPRMPERKPAKVGDETMPYWPVEKPDSPSPKPVERVPWSAKYPPPKEEPIALGPPPEPLVVEPLPEEPIMVEPLPEEEPIELEPMPETPGEPEVPVQFLEYLHRDQVPQKPIEDYELNYLADAINKEYPEGLYFVQERDKDGNILKMSTTPSAVEEIYPATRNLSDGTKQKIHRIILREIGSERRYVFFLGDFFANRLIKIAQEEMKKAS